MKYYVMKDKDMDGYLSRTLCRVNSKGVFEIYSSCTESSFGKWQKNERYENWFKEKNDNFEIYTPTKKEIEEIKFEADDAAYENYHTHVSPDFLDSKGRKHSEFIYQDYRSLDGYDADDGFSYQEIWNREDYDYYKDTKNKLLIKRDKETNEYFILDSDWVKPNDYYTDMLDIVLNYDFNKLELIKDFNEVISLLEKRFITDSFDCLEIENKDNYDYYYNKDNYLLRRDKKTKKLEIFMVGCHSDEDGLHDFEKVWMDINLTKDAPFEIDTKPFKESGTIKDIIRFIDKYYNDVISDESDIN